jgi:hypothetical protein
MFEYNSWSDVKVEMCLNVAIFELYFDQSLDYRGTQKTVKYTQLLQLLYKTLLIARFPSADPGAHSSCHRSAAVSFQNTNARAIMFGAD